MTAADSTNQNQFQLFTPPEAPERLPGDLSPAEWNAREDVSFHGTNVPAEHRPFDQEYMHSGTQKAASEILHTRLMGGNNFATLDHFPISFVPYEDMDTSDDESWKSEGRVGELHEDENDYGSADDPDFVPIPQSAPGRISGFRRSGPEVAATDRTANMAHTLAMTEGGGDFADITGSVRDSIYAGGGGSLLSPVFDRNMEHAKALRGGSTLSYSNEAEDTGSTSYVHRRNAVSSYAEDVVSNSHRPDHVKEAWANHIARGGEGPPVPFQQRVGHQKSLTGDDEPLYNTVTGQQPQVPVEETPRSKWKKKAE